MESRTIFHFIISHALWRFIYSISCCTPSWTPYDVGRFNQITYDFNHPNASKKNKYLSIVNTNAMFGKGRRWKLGWQMPKNYIFPHFPSRKNFKIIKIFHLILIVPFLSSPNHSIRETRKISFSKTQQLLIAQSINTVNL